MTEMVTIPRSEFEQMKNELSTLRDSSIYKRLIEFEKNVSKGKKLTREDLGF